MVVAIVILLVIAFFAGMYFYRKQSPTPVQTGTATRVSGGASNSPVVPGQTSKVSPQNPGSMPDGTGQDKGNGNAAMSAGMQG